MQNDIQFIAGEIGRWEGKMSRDPNDAGNWSSGLRGVGTLLGSNYGVTGRVWATYKGVDVSAVTMADIEAITLGDAVNVSVKLFYQGPGLDRLPWSRVTASLLDFGWGTGPVTAVKQMQDLLDLTQDGQIGPATIAAFTKRLSRSEEFFAGALWAMREEYYEDLVARRPSDGMYLSGWDNRSDYFTPGHPEGWWVRFAQ